MFVTRKGESFTVSSAAVDEGEDDGEDVDEDVGEDDGGDEGATWAAADKIRKAHAGRPDIRTGFIGDVGVGTIGATTVLRISSATK